jgi:ketosteroid isomerase-like protein
VSRENVEMLARGYEAVLREDWSQTDALLGPDFQISDRTLPEAAGPERGEDALRAARSRMSEVFEDFGYEVQEAIDLGDRVLVRARVFARGKGSGLDLDGIMGHLWTFSEGRASQLDVYGTWEEALGAVGMQE